MTNLDRSNPSPYADLVHCPFYQAPVNLESGRLNPYRQILGRHKQYARISYLATEILLIGYASDCFWERLVILR